MGITHFSILNTHPDVEVVAICDQSSTMLNILGKYTYIATYSDHRQMFDESQLDCVIISTPTDSHSQLAKTAIDNDIHIFLEKPFALSLEEGKGILEHLEGKTLINQVGYVNRFCEVFMEVKKLLDTQIIGEIKSFHAEMVGSTVLRDSKSGWRSKKKKGGGCMYEFASHCIDLIIYLLGQPDQVTGSVMQSIYSSEVEDLVRSTFLYSNAYSGTIMVNWSDATFRKPTNTVTILGTRGKILADKHGYKIFLSESDQSNGYRKGWNSRSITDLAQSVRFYVRGNEFTRQLDYFVDNILKKRTENIASFSEAFKTDLVIEQIVRDSALSTAERDGSSVMTPIFKKKRKKTSWWRQILEKFNPDLS